MPQVEAVCPAIRFGVVGDAWRLYRRHWTTWSLTMFVAMICVAVGEGLAALVLKIASAGIFGGFLGMDGHGFPLLHLLLGAMIGGYFLGGMVRMAVAQVRGKPPQVGDLFSVNDVWFDLTLGSALLGLLLSIGWGLLVIPGLIVGGLFLFTIPLIVDSRLPATGAMIQSFQATKCQWLNASVVHLAIAMIAGLGAIAGGIGVVVTGPLYVLSLAVLYRDVFLNPYSPSWDKPYDPYREFEG